MINMTRAALTASGLVQTRNAPVHAGHGYYFGGSSSPSFVLVLAVTDDSVTYCDACRLEARREQRWIFEDLVSRAGETMRKDAARTAANATQADISPAAERLNVQIAKVCADRVALHGAAVNLDNYDRVRVELVAGEGVDVYSYAGALGLIVDYSSEARTAAVECNRDAVNDFTKRAFASGERLDLTLTVVATIKACPTA